MIYMDNAATTAVDERVLAGVLPYLKDGYCNPSSAYTPAARIRTAINSARTSVGRLMGAPAGCIYFTSGGTESDNIFIRGVMNRPGTHMITTAIEHPAVLNTCRALEKQGVEVTYIMPDAEGYVSPADIEAAIRPSTRLISVMMANNETGTIEPVAEIGKLAHRFGILFHTDAVQAYGHIPIDVEAMNIDGLSLSAHKLHGLKGTGALYVRQGISLLPMTAGGGQEGGLRSGTENVPGIIGLGLAADIASEEMLTSIDHIAELRDRLLDGIRLGGSDMVLFGPEPQIPVNDLRPGRLPGNLDIGFKGIEGSSLLIRLDIQGICCSTGSACAALSSEPSHVLRAMGVSDEYIRGSIRLTLSKYTTLEDVDRTAQAVITSVSELKELTVFNKN